MRRIQNILYPLLLGGAVGLLVSLFLISSEVLMRLFSNYWYITPFVASLLLIWVHHNISKDRLKFGVDEVVLEIEKIDTKVMDSKNVLLKVIGAIASLASGFPLGRLGPAAHLGGAIGSNLAYRFKLSKEETRLWISCGTAAALAGIFHSPIFGTLFVLEFIYIGSSNFKKNITPLMISSLTASSIVSILWGKTILPSFYYEEIPFGKEIIYAVVIGIILGLGSLIYSRVTFIAKDRCEKDYRFFYPLLASGILVLSLYFVPEFRLFIYDELSLNELVASISRFELFLFFWLYLAVLVTSFRFGAIGGVFAPAVVLGALLGGVILPGNGLILGATALLSGFTRTPFSITVLFSLVTGSTDHILPLFIVAVLASLIHGNESI